MFAKNFIRIGTALLLGLLVLAPGEARAQSKEYQIKAAFLFNFAQFVDWPPDAFTNGTSPFCIGIMGDDPFGAVLDETVQGEKVNGHPLVVQRFRPGEDVKGCQILFVSRSENERLDQILAGLKGKSVLTVADQDGFLQKGGIIRFVTEQNKIHLRICADTAKIAGLTIRSKMLRLAEIVEPGKD